MFFDVTAFNIEEVIVVCPRFGCDVSANRGDLLPCRHVYSLHCADKIFRAESFHHIFVKIVGKVTCWHQCYALRTFLMFSRRRHIGLDYFIIRSQPLMFFFFFIQSAWTLILNPCIIINVTLCYKFVDNPVHTEIWFIFLRKTPPPPPLAV